VIGVVLFLCSAWLRRSAARDQTPPTPPRSDPSAAHPPLSGSGSPFSPRAYWLVVALEIVALFGGAAILGTTGHSEYISAWFATVVGAHFLVFGRLFWAGYYWVGVVLIVGGIAGAVVGVAGGGLHGIEAVSGLIAAASLFATGGSILLRGLVLRKIQ